ncbi:hypothetical protein [Haliangium sp.]|uniref:hypothetical protein n=1 Tax=Haliangium sp. TaxID=2663208 RepID=UPI003D0B79FA
MNLTTANLVTSYFSLYVFPTGRRIYAMLELQRRATALGLTATAEHAARCVAHDRHLHKREGRYTPLRTLQYGPEARALDQVVDRKLAAVDGYLESQMRMFEEDSERGKAATYLRDRFFPRGLAAVIQQSFIQEHVYVSELVAAREEPEVAAAIAVLPEAGVMLDDLKAANDNYGAAISQDEGRPTAEELRLLHAHGQRLMAEVVSLAVGHFGVNAPDDHNGLRHLLEPISEQQERMARLRRRRRRVVDVDPDTGDELPPDDEAGELPDDGEPPDETGELPGDVEPPTDDGELPGDDTEQPEVPAA